MPRYSVTVERSVLWRFDVESPTAEEAAARCEADVVNGDTINAHKAADVVSAVEIKYLDAYTAPTGGLRDVVHLKHRS